MKRFAILCLCAALALTAALGAAAEEAAQQEDAILSRVLGSGEPFKKMSVKGKYKTYDALGVDNEIVSVWSNRDGYVFRARALRRGLLRESAAGRVRRHRQGRPGRSCHFL